VIGPPQPPAGSDGGPSFRKKVGAKVGGLPIPPASAPSVNYRAVVHAFA